MFSEHIATVVQVKIGDGTAILSTISRAYPLYASLEGTQQPLYWDNIDKPKRSR
jgi:hypothetical protein